MHQMKKDCDNYEHPGAVHCNIGSSQPRTKQTVLMKYNSVI
jgi:hypothetical protein